MRESDGICEVDADAAGDVSAAVMALRLGGVIAYPTEAVFGLGCDPRNEHALQRILDIKGRDVHKGFILIASTQHQLTPFLARIEPAWQAQFDSVWPGPVTFVVPSARGVSNLLSGFRDTLAVRVSDHPVVRLLCEQFGGAIVSTSANRSGFEPCRTQAAVRALFAPDVNGIVTGSVGGHASPSKIFDVRTQAQIR
jgi:L-threonylcarbamoyladenylate synthase